MAHGIELYRQLPKLSPAEQTFYRNSELARLKLAGSSEAIKPGSDQWLDMMHAWYTSLGVGQAASTSMLVFAPPPMATTPVATSIMPADEDTRAAEAASSQAAPSVLSVVDSTEPPAIRSGSLVDMQRTRAISQLEFEVARNPTNSKLRRDLSILYLQAGRVADAKVQARKAEEASRQRHAGVRPAE